MSILEQKSFISAIPPFDRLEEHELEAVADAMDIAYFKTGEYPIRQGTTPDTLYLIIKGIVHELQEEEVVSVCGSQDTFDTMSLLKGKSKHDFLVYEEAICYTLPKEIFLTLIQHNKTFEEFYYQDLSKRLNALIEQRNTKELSSFMVAKIQDIYIHPPLYVDAAATVYDAVQTMSKSKANFILVKRDNEIGIVTDKDLRDHVVLQRYSIDDAVGNIATFNLIEMEIHDFLLHALLIMIRSSIKHLLIHQEHEIIGVLEQIDLLSYLSNHTRLVAVQIDRAQNKEQLKIASQNMTKMIHSFQAHGMKIKYMMEWVQELNQQVFKKLYSFIAPPEVVANTCLLVMGSEGRGEQILKTDQDNAIIFRDGFEYDGIAKIAQDLTDTLLDFGYPPCPGKIMASNPYWCKSLQEFKEQIFQWVVEFQDLMNLAIFCDAISVAGDASLLTEAKTYLYDRLQDHQTFFSHFAKSSIAFETPLGMFANFVVEKLQHKNELDLKKGGIFPIIHGIRSLALEYRVTESNTIERIKALVEKEVLEKPFAVDLIEALGFMITLRLRFELEKAMRNEPYDNYIKPNKLNKMERDLLKDSFRIVNHFKQFVTYHFKLDRVT